MKVTALWAGIFLAVVSLSAQDYESARLSKLPWNADWMEQAKDTMVHGESYHGYPGPLPKMYAALGEDPAHPGIDFELEVIVNRDALFWEGNCNGWASAAIQFDEPGPMVVNGVKFFRGEAKALLTSIWKDHVLVRVSEREQAGMKASSFHKILNDFTAANKPIIFDVAIGTESWNYPVAGFEKTLFESEDWIDVDITVLYTSTLDILAADQDFGEVVFRELNYTYRYSKAEPVVYEWTGASVFDRPHHAWFPTLPYNSRSWSVYGNHYYNLETWNQLQELAAKSDAAVDLYEPNDTMESAPLLAQNLVLASIHDNQPDYFRIEAAQGEPVGLKIEVYDGPAVDVQVMKGDAIVASLSGVGNEISLNVPTNEAGDYYLKISRNGADGAPVSFYRILQEEHRSWYRAPQFGSILDQTRMTFINHDETLNVVSGDQTAFVEGNGAVSLELNDGDFVRAIKRGVVAVEGSNEKRTWKQYYRKHPNQLGYTIPHFTFRNGWSTSIEVVAQDSSQEVNLEVYGANGQMLQSVKLDQDMLAGIVPLHAILTRSAQDNGAWFRLQSGIGNLLTGVVYFEHSSGLSTHYDIENKPTNGEFALYDLRPHSKGWTGISLLNTSGTQNEILYRLHDETGKELDEGFFELAPGERLLGTPQSITGMEIEEGYYLSFYSVFNVETLAIDYQSERNIVFSHRLPNVVLDYAKDTFISASSDVDAQTIVFANLGNTTNWILLEGYSSDGRLQGEMRTNGRAMKAWEIAHVKLSEILLDSGFEDADAPIAYFKVRGQRALYVNELIGHPDQMSKTYVKNVRVYDDP